MLTFNKKIFKYFAPDDGDGGENKNNNNAAAVIDDIDVSKIENVDDIEVALDKLQDTEFEINDIPGEQPTKDDDVPPQIAPEDKDVPPDKADEGDKIESDKETPDNKKTDDDIITPPEKTPPEEVTEPDKEDKAEVQDKDNQLLLTDEFISNLNLSQDEVKYLEKFKGKPISEALKSYANAQKLIGKKKEDLLKTIELPKTDLNVPPKPEKPEEIQKAKNDLIYEQLSKEFPDMPKDDTERKVWLNDLGYDDFEKANRFVRQKEIIEREVDQIWDYTEKLSQNAPKINEKLIEGEINTITDYFADKFEIDPKVLGYDLTLDEEGNNPIIDSLLASENNPEDFDNNLIQDFNGVKILKQGELVKKFFAKELPKIIKEVKIQTRREAMEAIKSNKKATPSLLNAPVKGAADKKEIDADYIKQLNDIDQIEKLLDEEDSKDFV